MNKLATKFATAFALVLFSAAGCGGGGGAGGPANVDTSQQISAVSESDKSDLCDWFADKMGGYGTEPSCGQAFLSAPPDHASCMTDFPVCAVTVGQFESCVNTVLAAQNACTEQALLGAQASADCQAVGNAGCFD